MYILIRETRIQKSVIMQQETVYKALQRRKDMLACTGFSKAFRKAVDRGAKEMAQQYGALAALARSLGSVPSTLLVVYNHTQLQFQPDTLFWLHGATAGKTHKNKKGLKGAGEVNLDMQAIGSHAWHQDILSDQHL